MSRITEINLSQQGVNDEFATIINWLVEDNEPVKKGQYLVEVETTKTLYEIDAPEDGYLRVRAKVGQQLKIGSLIGYITDSSDVKLPSRTPENISPGKDKHEAKFTKKALRFAKEHNIDISMIKSDHIVTEKDLLKMANPTEVKTSLPPDLPSTKKVMIYGAIASASLIDLEIINSLDGYCPACYVDDEESKQGKNAYGLKVLSFDDFKRICKKESIDSFCISIGSMPVRREKFNLCLNLGLNPVSLIHPSALISNYAEIGSNVLIKRGAIIGPGVSIGNGCIIDNGVVISHDCRIEPFVHLAPSASLGSNVHIKSFSVIGIRSSISTGITIGQSTIVVTGASVTQNVGDNVVFQGNPGFVSGKSRIPKP